MMFALCGIATVSRPSVCLSVCLSVCDVDVPRAYNRTQWVSLTVITRITRKSCTGQVLPSAKYRPTRLVVDAALRPIGKSRHGGHKIANISRNCERI